MSRLVFVVLLAGLLAPAPAQLTIGRGDVAQTVGDSFTYKYNTQLAPVSVGNPGGPHTWVFDTSAYVGTLQSLTLVTAGSTPFESLFPDANVIWRIRTIGEPEYTTNFYNLSDTAQLGIGLGVVTAETATVFRWEPPDRILALPAGYGTEWTALASHASGMGDIRVVVTVRARRRMDAWGTAVTPAGSFPCLRLNSYDTTVTATYYRDSLLFSDTVGNRSYAWLTRHHTPLAEASGPDNDTGLVFPYSDCYRVLVAATVGLAEETPARFRADRVDASPNPCVERTRISFPPSRPGRTVVMLCDAAGRLVRTLTPTDESGMVTWDRRDEGGRRVKAGVYLVIAGRGRFKLLVAD